MTKMYDYQQHGVDRLLELGGRGLLADEPGLGKAQPLTAKILTPQGWKRMGDIKVGDQTIGSDGRPTNVIGVYPQGMKKVFRVTFSDGASTECCDDHLWLVNTSLRNWQGLKPRVKTTKEIRSRLKDSSNKRLHYISMVRPVEFAAVGELPLHPYLLGYILANGGLTASSPRLTIPDEETVDRLRRLVPTGTQIKVINKRIIDFYLSGTEHGHNPALNALRDLGLMGKGSPEKFIPESYLRASPTDRLLVLQGLMDGDGSVTTNGNVLEYATSSPQLADDFMDLVQSLGGCARKRSRTPWYTYKGERRVGLVSHRMTVAMPKGLRPFLLSRKDSVYKERDKYQPSRVVASVELVGDKECQCIAVDAPDHQYVTDEYILTHNTVQALQFLSKAEGAFPALVVCPATLKFNWEAEARKHMGWDCEVLSGKRPPARWSPGEQLTIINYDILYDWQASLINKFNTVILDESHYLQNRTAKRTKAARQVASGARYCLALTGTPVLNRPCDLWPTLNILRPKLFPSYHPFGVRYGNARKTHWGWDYSGASNTAELHQILTDKVMVRRTKKEVLTELPDKTIVVSPVELPAAGMKEYQLAEKDFMKWLVRNKPHRLTSALRAEQLSKLGEMKRIAGRHKVKLVLEWVEDFLASDQKLVLFAIHRAVIDEIRAALGRDCVTITGDTAQKDRQRAVEAFQGAKGPRVFLGNIRAAGVGITLTRSSTVLFAELDWVPAVMSQASDRVHRISQKENVLINFLVARNTIEESLMRVLQEKQAVADNVIDGAGGGGDFDVYDRLCEELGRKK